MRAVLMSVSINPIMCLGSETTLSAFTETEGRLYCMTCGEYVTTPFPDYALLPVHFLEIGRNCLIHDTPMQLVCDTWQCAACYLGEPFRPAKPSGKVEWKPSKFAGYGAQRALPTYEAREDPEGVRVLDNSPISGEQIASSGKGHE